jgi:protein-disulfide isomerase
LIALRISRQRLVACTGALLAAGLISFASTALADVKLDALLRPGPLPDVVLGKGDAPVTVVEYGSLTCPHCAHFHEATFPALKKRYIDSGKVRFIFREFPRDDVDLAAFSLVRCTAGSADGKEVNTDKAMALMGVLFASQDKWYVRNPIAPLMLITKQAGLTEQTFNACLSNEKLQHDLKAVGERAEKEFKVDGTPAIFVNGKRLDSGNAIEDLAKAIDPLLPKS